MEAFMQNSQKVSDMKLIPITINYDRVFEVETFPFELLGEKKFEPSLMRTLAVAKNIGTSYGRVVINYCSPISVTKYLKDFFPSEATTLFQEAPQSDNKMKFI